ncbi:hypothetical protein SDC9_109650 [bioreactor metagenome]|uniref:Glycosyl transferase family 1 domain-containing protein n=1 Tax=bioreactor metagenome TaxID=1076179 RepID=A0A645BBS2_9ZZZZ
MPSRLDDNVKVLCASEYVQNMLSQFGYPYKSELLSVGIEDYASKVDTLDRERLQFAMIGSYEFRQGHDVLMRAIESMPSGYRQKAMFIFAGNVNDQKVYDTVLAFCNQNSNTTILQDVSRDEIIKIYKESMCVVAPSRDDSGPMAIMEGLMLSKICLCSSKTGMASVIEDGISGFVFKNEDHVELSRKMIKIIDQHDQLGELRSKGRKVYEDYFTMDKFKKNIERIVDENISLLR